jgi:hypothetical protein
MKTPDTLLEAAKATAIATDLEWSFVQKFYQALQRSNDDTSAYLPRSKGRQLWVAHPNFISRLLVALAVVENPNGAVTAVDWSTSLDVDEVTSMHPLGVARGTISPLEAQMAMFLSNPKHADELDKVVFQKDCNKVVFCLTNGDKLSFSAESASNANSHLTSLKIQRRGVVSGETFQRLARMVHWRRASDKPTRSVRTSSDNST